MLIKGFIPKSFFTFRRGDLKFVGFHILIKTPNIYSIGLKDNTVSRTFFINLMVFYHLLQTEHGMEDILHLTEDFRLWVCYGKT
jgi:hypothetical protein